VSLQGHLTEQPGGKRSPPQRAERSSNQVLTRDMCKMSAEILLSYL